MSIFTCTKHAMDRIRERYGVSDQLAANQWVSRKINQAKESFKKDDKTHYLNGSMEIVVAGANKKVITVMENSYRSSNDFIRKTGEMLTKELNKQITVFKREYRKADIKVAEYNLNYLKAKNPKIKQTIQKRMNDAMDERDDLFEKIKDIENTAEHYGVQIQ